MTDEDATNDEPVTTGTCLCGAVHWHFTGPIPDATSCNCTACRRYAPLWAYDFEGGRIQVDDPEGVLVPYTRPVKPDLSFNFCSRCGNLVSWRGLRPGRDGRIRTAVNLRLAEPEAVAAIPLLRFDGLVSFEDLPMDGRTVTHLWF